jgi:hypothetical protein
MSTMGVHHKDGYSADVEGFLVVGDARFRLAKTNDRAFTLAEPCELPPGASGEILIIVDGDPSSQLVEMPSGICAGQSIVEYKVAAPF